MGGFHKSLGQVYKPIRKIVDPLNIMDPFRILPGSSAGFTKKGAFTLDPNFGGPLKKMLGGGGGGSSYTPMTKGLSSNPEYFQQQQQMLQNMQAQQREKLANLRTQSPTYPTTTAATTSPATTTATAATSPTTATLAQTKSSDTTMPSDLPMDFSYKPPTATPKVATANTFSLPDMSSIKFGGA
jgi:hypothetical protein